MAFSISIPSTPPRSGPSPPRNTAQTNSLVVTGLPAAFFHPVVLQALRSHFAFYGEIYAWAPIRAFARVILVYYAEEDAERAKLGSDGLTIDATSESPKATIRVYRADPTPIITSTSGTASPTGKSGKSPFHLQPPVVEKNFLISPPGSPPVGWESSREEPPNNSPLAQDLICALRRLQFAQDRSAAGLCSRSSSGRSSPAPGLSVIMEPEEGPGVGVYVEDCGEPEAADDDDDDDSSSDEGEGWFYGSPRPVQQRFMPMPTMRPPMPMTA